MLASHKDTTLRSPALPKFNTVLAQIDSHYWCFLRFRRVSASGDSVSTCGRNGNKHKHFEYIFCAKK
jgi:hypothetical protein